MQVEVDGWVLDVNEAIFFGNELEGLSSSWVNIEILGISFSIHFVSTLNFHLRQSVVRPAVDLDEHLLLDRHHDLATMPPGRGCGRACCPATEEVELTTGIIRDMAVSSIYQALLVSCAKSRCQRQWLTIVKSVPASGRICVIMSCGKLLVHQYEFKVFIVTSHIPVAIFTSPPCTAIHEIRSVVSVILGELPNAISHINRICHHKIRIRSRTVRCQWQIDDGPSYC